MTCIKTGARVLLEAYGWVVPADLHSVGDCIVIVYNAQCPYEVYSKEDATHILHDSSGYWPDAQSGIIVVQAKHLLEMKEL